ncbi:unnamed protein product [Linum tenue]|uniref:Uncharacterized protein n=1 Tax=Linum tenue TaxID=586396 RepID=A0AAV0HV36_9ROSI|nr:unnamed protein product [Linum tenue]
MRWCCLGRGRAAVARGWR